VPSHTPPLHPPPAHITDPGRRSRARLARAGVLLAAATAVWLVRRPAPLPVLGTVPPFVLTERSGEPLRADDLIGRVWVADFVFTRCPDVCPALTARMARLQDAAGVPDPIRLVSFSVDPEHDTPEVLRTYAARAGAGSEWLFVTGPRDRIAALLRDGFRVAFADDGPPAAPITHSDRFVLVDRQLRIRGYYHGSDPEDLRRLARHAAALRDGRVS
jgi:protein SCO1/2